MRRPAAFSEPVGLRVFPPCATNRQPPRFRACWPPSRSGNDSGTPDRPVSPPSFGEAFFVMTDELMLFLALAGGFTVVLVEWWARQTP
jgi:hypothetical protein